MITTSIMRKATREMKKMKKMKKRETRMNTAKLLKEWTKSKYVYVMPKVNQEMEKM